MHQNFLFWGFKVIDFGTSGKLV